MSVESGFGIAPRALKARLHRRFLSRNSMQFFVPPKLQLQYRTCKPAAISARFYRRHIAGVSNLYEILMQFCRDFDKNVTIMNQKGPLGRFCRSQFVQP